MILELIAYIFGLGLEGRKRFGSADHHCCFNEIAIIAEVY